MTFIIGLIITIFSGFAYTINIELLSILFFILIYFMQNVRRPIATDYLTENIPSELTATGLSIETQAKTLTIAILAPTIGLLADIFGIGVSISIVTVVVLLIFPFIKVK